MGADGRPGVHADVGNCPGSTAAAASDFPAAVVFSRSRLINPLAALANRSNYGIMDDADGQLSQLSADGPDAEQALHDLFFAHAQALISFARRYVGERETAEDIVQNVFLALWQNRQSITIGTDVKSYLFTATRNQAINVLRHSKTAEAAKDQIRLTLPDPGQPIDRVEFEQTRQRIENAVNGLPEQSKRVFLMSRLDGLTYSQIATVLGISMKTVETLMGRALKHIRSILTMVLVGTALVRIFRYFL